MEKFKKIIENAIKDKRRIKKYLSSSYDIKTAMKVYDNLAIEGKAITINSKIADICKNCGLKVSNYGTGFLIEK